MSAFFEGPTQRIFLQPHKQGQRKNKIALVSLHSTFNFTLHNRSRLSHTGPSESFDSALICTRSCLCITSILSLDGLNKAAILARTFWVDFFPILKHAPSSVPAAGIQKQATHWRELNASMAGKPFRFVQEQWVGELFFFELINFSK